VEFEGGNKYDTEKLQKLGWTYRPMEETLQDSIECYRRLGILNWASIQLGHLCQVWLLAGDGTEPVRGPMLGSTEVKVQSCAWAFGLQGMYYSTGRYLLRVVNLRVQNWTADSEFSRTNSSGRSVSCPKIYMHFLIADMGCMVSDQPSATTFLPQTLCLEKRA